MKKSKLKQILILVILLSSVVLFVTFIGISNRNIREESDNVVNELENIDRELQNLEVYKNETIDDFYNAMIKRQGGYFELLNVNWSLYETNHPNSKSMRETIEDFISDNLKPIMDISTASVVTVYNNEGELLYKKQNSQKYPDIFDNLSEKLDIGENIQILNGSPDEPYGTADRFFFISDVLEGNISGEKVNIEIYLGFNEKDMYSNYLDYIDINKVMVINNELKNTIKVFNNRILTDLMNLQYISLVFLIVFAMTGIYIMNSIFFDD